MDSRFQFYTAILDHYNKLAADKVPLHLLNQLCEQLTDYIYEYYTDCFVKYPKSTKRYSTLKIADLDHPQVHEKIINFLKKNSDRYLDYGPILLNVSQEKFLEIEKNIDDFNKIW